LSTLDYVSNKILLSDLLKNKVPMYLNFARVARRWVETQRANRRTDEMAALNAATQAAVESLQTQFIELKDEYKEYRRTTDLQMQALLRNQNLILQALNSLPNRLATTIGIGIGNGGQPPPPPPQQPAAPRNEPPPAPQAQQPTAAAGDEEKEEEKDDGALPDDDDDLVPPFEPAAAAAVPPAPPVPPPAGPNCGQGGRSVVLRAALQENALDVINDQAVQPACNTKTPVGYRNVLNEWKANDFKFFRGLDKRIRRRWKNVTRFNSRLRVIEEIERLQDIEDNQADPRVDPCTMERAADLLDTLLRLSPLNFTKHVAARRKENPQVDCRRRVPANPPVNPPAPFFQPAQARRVDNNGAQARQAGPGPQRRRQQQPRAPPEDNGDAFAAAFANVSVVSEAARERDRLRAEEVRTGLEVDRAAMLEERERRQTQGVLLYTQMAGVDGRNLNDMSRFARQQYARRHLGPP
jgi:TolA-binding protein